MKEIGTIYKDFKVDSENSIHFLEVFKSIFNIEFSQRLLNELDYTYDCYQELIDKYELMEDIEKNEFNQAMYFNETVFLHRMEIESEKGKQLLIESLVDEDVRKDSIGYICEKNLKYNNIIVANIKRLHTILMDGVAPKEAKYKSFRKDDNFFVGFWKDNEHIHVQYFPPLADSIEEAMELILIYLNDPELNKKDPNVYMNSNWVDFDKKYALFVQPLIVQALLVILQAFNDGNSRTARVISSATILKHTNHLFDKEYQLPLLYLSRGYFAFREQYRNLIKAIAINPCSETWNQWIIFSLHAIQAYIETCNRSIDDNKLIKYKNRVKKSVLDKQ